ncbi:MAG: hypothetical protein J3R72DRAFT_494646 [Linnemannia gamsii]|nr:MAG: hypothetical protein J3R72DRAFT_494646 [Linnemannia gamsii]
MSEASLFPLPPELISLFAPHLNQHSLAQCVRVCHDWRSIFEPFLWRNVDLTTVDDSSNNSVIASAFTRNRHYIRRLAVEDPKLVRFLALYQPPMRNLQSQDLNLIERAPSSISSLSAPGTTTSFGEAIAQTLGKAPMPTTLLTGYPNLESFSIGLKRWFNHIDRANAFHEIMATCSVRSLKSLTFHYIVHDGTPCRQRFPSEPINDHLLEFRQAVDRQQYLLPFIALRRLVIQSFEHHIIPTKLAFLAQCPNLERIEIDKPDFMMDDFVSALLEASLLSWKVLTLPYMFEFGLSSHESLQQKVHAFDAYKDHVEGVHDRTWAAGPRMEYLQMQIVGVPRPDVVCRDNGTPLSSWMFDDMDGRHRYDVQRWIYKQLGRMTGLTYLLLGMIDIDRENLDIFGIHDSFPFKSASLTEIEDELKQIGESCRLINYQCLEFSLESGLEFLGGLKELEVLDVKATAHRIGVAEWSG